VGETVVKVDRTTAHNGHASARMEYHAEEKCVLVCKKFAVAPGDGLRFEEYMPPRFHNPWLETRRGSSDAYVDPPPSQRN
jgi:hypothetical protein